MKKRILYLVTLFFSLTLIAQENSNSKDHFTYKRINVANSEKGTLDITGGEIKKNAANSNRAFSSGIGETPGALSVSLTGGSEYSIPIAVPKGIDGVIPKVSLTYNSHSGNGLAGYGWDVSGISSISRIASSKYHDGVIDAIDFDNLDRFALDGQRLILKSGSYGGNGAVYETENYSNVKITSYGVSTYGSNYGPAYFKVQYPDGSTAFYGETTNSRSQTTYALTTWKNAQGIKINYQYIKETSTTGVQRNSIAISKVLYGGSNSTSNMNEVHFVYGKRNRVEQAYVHNVTFVRENLLKEIKVFSNNIQFRRYQLTHDQSSLEYDRLTAVQEYSGDESLSHSPIYFDYSDSSPLINYQENTMQLGLLNIEQRNSKAVTLDLTGNGKIDFIIQPKEPSEKDKFWIFKDLQNTSNNTPYLVNTAGLYEDIFSANFLNHQNKVLEGRGLFVVQKGGGNTMKFMAYANGVSSPINYQYEKIWGNPPTYTYDSDCGTTQTHTVPHEYISGDFNGDGLTDVIAISKPYTSRSCSTVSNCGGSNGGGFGVVDPVIDPDPGGGSTGGGNCCQCSTSTVNVAQATFIDLNRNLTSNYTTSLGYLGITLTGDNKIHAADVNGDRKTDFILVEDGKMIVYSLDSNDNLQLLWQVNDNQISTDRPLLFGDYNGDGKTDFLNPTTLNSSSFGVYISTGTQFDKEVLTQPFTYKESIQVNSNTTHTNNLIPLDLNGDGRTDIIDYHSVGYSNSSNGLQKVSIYNNMGRSYTTSYPEHPDFEYRGAGTKYNNVTHFPVPIFLSSEEPNSNLEFATISNQWVSSFNFTQDHKEDMLLKSVQSNGVTYNIEYNSLSSSEFSSDNHQVYYTSNNLSYPYVDLAISPQTRVVTALKRVVSGFPTIKQNYSYYGAVYNLEGLSFLGYQGIAGSNWHTDSADRIFNVSKFDPVLRGAPLEDYTSEFGFDFYSSPSSFISKTTYSSSSTLSASKVFKLQVNSSTTANTLEGRTISVSNLFDAYNNLQKVTKTYTGGITSTVDYTYSNSTGSTYYIGRPSSVVRTMVNNGESFSTENQFFYSGMLLTEVKSKGNGTSFDSQIYQYDSFGNITKKTTTPHASSSREVRFEYDSSGRFITKSIGVEGLITNYQYNLNTSTLSSETNAFSQTTNYVYDSWNRVTRVTDYLGKNFNTSYSESSYEYTVTESGDDGSGRVFIYDPLKRLRKARQKNALGEWISVSYEYDVLDRLHRKSEPYFNSNPSQWNVTNYDVYGRVISHNGFTGSFVNIQYNGLNTTVDDGTKSVTATRDGLGNVTKVVDPGGTVNYTYFGNNGVKSSDYGGNLITLEQDGWGRKTKMTDSSFGQFTYSYNGFGELTSEVSPKGTRSFTYDNYGKVTQEIHQGEETDLLINYSYNSTDKLLNTIQGNNFRTNEAFTYTYLYDSYKRSSISKELNGKASFEHQLTYDEFGRIHTKRYISRNLSDNTTSDVKVKNVYQSNSGEMVEILDFNTNASLWKIDELNDKGKLTKSTLGNGIEKNRSYNTFGYLTNITDKTATNNPVQSTATDVDYSFHQQRGNLLSRNNKVFSWSETFQYDNLDRLLSISGPNSKSHTYDDRGRITNNSHVGDYAYLTSSSYQLKEVDLNTRGDLYYQNNPIQKVKYNAFKKPVTIHSKGKGRVDFDYGILKNRSHAYYGGEQEDKSLRRYQKHYSAITPVEIEEDSQGGTKIITYVGGTAYSAPIVHVKQTGSNAIDDYHYIHRDYLGSILAITDSSANIVEQRQFSAWGAVDIFEKSGVTSEFDHTSLISRGFTGHEHFSEVGLIHMNGRMYDPSLSRFLSPDNYIQDSSNTQNFNRYSYVMNNPLKYTDSSGEIIETLIGIAVVSLGIYSVARAIEHRIEGSVAPRALRAGAIGAISAVATGVPVSDPDPKSTQPERPWYVEGLVTYMSFRAGFRAGFAAGGESTWEFVKSLGTEQGWIDLGNGFLFMAEMASMSPHASVKRNMMAAQMYTSTANFIEKVPDMSYYEVGHHLGYGTYKGFEEILLTKGTGFIINRARNVVTFAKYSSSLNKVQNVIGILDDDLANNFFGRNYVAKILDEDMIMYRAGDDVSDLGQWFSFDRPISEIQVRIDKAVKPVWPNGNKSIITHGYKFKAPKGTVIYEGPIAPQGGFYMGGTVQGTMQNFIRTPWNLKGSNSLELLEKFKLY